jgi:hypothetical protein
MLMKRPTMMLSALALATVAFATGEHPASAQATHPLPTLQMVNPARTQLRAPLAGGNMFDSVDVGIGGAQNKWMITINGLGPAPVGNAPRLLLVCTVEVASAEAANAIVARIVDARTSTIGCNGAWTQSTAGGWNTYRLNIDLTAPLDANTGLRIAED